MDWTKFLNFKKESFDQGGPPMDENFMHKLQTARSLAEELCKDLGYPRSSAYFVINSGSRSEEHNRQVGGKPDSTHLYGRACDIKATNSRSRFIIAKSLLLAGFTRIGIGEDFIHVDIGYPNKDIYVMWTYYE